MRNESEIAALGVVAGRTTARQEMGRELLGEFGALVRRAEASDDPAAVMQEFLDDQETLPVIEGDLVHFVYQGDVDAVGVYGTFLEWWDPVAMHQVGTTDVFFLSVQLDPTAVWEYRFHPDFEGREHDPRNPLRVGGMSVLRMPQWGKPRPHRRCRRRPWPHRQLRVSQRRA